MVWAVWGMATPLVLIVVIEAVLTYRLKKPLEEVLHGTEHAFHDLDLLSGVLARVEAHTFQAPACRRCSSSSCRTASRSSQAIAKLRTLVDLINSRHNIFVRIIDAPLMYSVQAGVRGRALAPGSREALRLWVDCASERSKRCFRWRAIALSIPADPFPEFCEGRRRSRAKNSGIRSFRHDCLCAQQCEHTGEARVLLVSGSNMSGKSTLLRAVGMNVVLAMAGAPVRARRLRLTPLQVGASIRINDSLQEGSSRFYAEITRLRQILRSGRRKSAVAVSPG